MTFGYRLKLRHYFPFIFLFLLGFGSCKNHNDAPDVSDVKISLNTRRLDMDLAALDTNNLAQGLQTLKGKYPDFLDFYLDTVMGFSIEGRYADTVQGVRSGLRTF